MERAAILVVDDDPIVRRVLPRALAAFGMPVLVAEDGLSALELARREHPALIIMDVCMPRMTGHEACALLRADKTTNAIPILMLTGLAEIEDELTSLHKGADDYLAKPFNTPELLARISALMRRSGAWRDRPQ